MLAFPTQQSIMNKATVKQHFVKGVKDPQMKFWTSSYGSFILSHGSCRTSSSPPKMCSFINSHQKTWLLNTHQHIMGTIINVSHSHRLLFIHMWSQKTILMYFSLLSRDPTTETISLLWQCTKQVSYCGLSRCWYLKYKIELASLMFFLYLLFFLKNTWLYNEIGWWVFNLLLQILVQKLSYDDTAKKIHKILIKWNVYLLVLLSDLKF